MERPCVIHGLHEPGGEFLMAEPGWILFTQGIGDDPDNHAGADYRRWSEQGYGIITRLNYGYGIGTIPSEGRYQRFATRCAWFVRNSRGCHIWIIGNEPNHAQERPGGVPITPRMYADCYVACRQAIKGLADREYHEVVPAPVAPWNNQTPYPGNERGDWVKYFTDVLDYIMERDAFPDGLALHTYTHGHDPRLITDESRMNAPFRDRRYNFRSYVDFMDAIPEELYDRPVYITEMDADEAWKDVDNGWVQEAYKEIDRWNRSEDQPIMAAILYRWPKIDKWYIDGKQNLHRDIRSAFARKHTWCVRRKQLGCGGT